MTQQVREYFVGCRRVRREGRWRGQRSPPAGSVPRGSDLFH
jgi:hypothetical protein